MAFISRKRGSILWAMAEAPFILFSSMHFCSCKAFWRVSVMKLSIMVFDASWSLPENSVSAAKLYRVACGCGVAG